MGIDLFPVASRQIGTTIEEKSRAWLPAEEQFPVSKNAARRQEAFRMHCSGWDEQMKNIEQHVAT
jgi:hypothetical protein